MILKTDALKKVVIFKQSSIGDCLMALYFLQNVRAQNPNARCAIVVGSRGAMIKDMLAAYPWIEVVEANRKSISSLAYLLQKYHSADLVVMPYTGGTLGLSSKIVAVLLAGLKGKILGFDDKSSLTTYLYTKMLPLGGKRVAPKTLENQLLGAAGIPVAQQNITFTYVPQPGLLQKFGVTKKNFCMVHLFSGSITRGLSPERRQDLVNELSKALPTVPLLFTGTKREQEELQKLTLPPQAKIITTSVQEIAELEENAGVVVSLGTGTSHIAAALQIPLVVLVNCQGVQWVGPEQWGSAPIKVFCNVAACPQGHDYSGYAKCIDSVDMQKVAEAAKGFI